MPKRSKGLLYFWPKRSNSKIEVERSDARMRRLLVVISILVGLCLTLLSVRGLPNVSLVIPSFTGVAVG